MRVRRRRAGRPRRPRAEAPRKPRPELFWLAALVLLSAAALGVYRPACHATAEARGRYARAAGEVEALNAEVQGMREERAGLERGDRVLWEAKARACGMVRPGERSAARGRAADAGGPAADAAAGGGE